MQRKEAAPRAVGGAKERAIQRGIGKIRGIEKHRRLMGLWKLFNTRASAGVEDSIANPDGLEMPASYFSWSKTSDGILLYCKAVKGLSQVEARAIFSIGGQRWEKIVKAAVEGISHAQSRAPRKAQRRRLISRPPALQRPPAEPPYFCDGHFKANFPPG
jgi:hypothetical protein